MRKSFCLCDNCIWITIVKLFLWRTRYFSSSANVLRRSPKILLIKMTDFLQLMRASFFWKCSKFNLYFKNPAKSSEKVLCFWDNSIWIGISKLSLLRTGYFSLAANVLTSSPKNWHVNKRDFSEHNLFASDQWIW